MAVMSLPPDPETPAPKATNSRRHLHIVDERGRVPRAVTLPNSHRLLQRAARDVEQAIMADARPYPAGVERPKTRGDCASMPRPCPFVSCAHHLALDVDPETGAMKVNFPDLDLEEMDETCSLDVADRGGTTLDEIGVLLRVVRERIRQIEVSGLAKIKDDRTGRHLGVPPERTVYAASKGPAAGCP
jgi:hypothetical protein